MHLLLFMTTMFFSADTLTPGDHERTLSVDNTARQYLVHVPAKYDGSSDWPVVLIFHGGASNAEQMVRFSGLSEKADEAGFLAVYPSGSGRLPKILTWNGGNCCGYAMTQKIDDVAFVGAILDDLEKSGRIDKKRIFATGMSNGAIMSYRLAAELSDRIAAIAPVSGPMGTESCTPKRPVPVMHFHGTKDEFAPFVGGKGAKSLSGTIFYSVDHSNQAWIKANGCPIEPANVKELPDKAKDGTSAIIKTFGPGKEGAEVVLVTISGQGHTWPGRDSRLASLGATTNNVSANDLMWEFFKRHPLK